MRICHVSPHLPPDQAANALLPVQLGLALAAKGHAVSFVAHEPSHGTVDDAATGLHLPVSWIQRRRGSGLTRFMKLDAWALVRRVNRALNDAASDADLLHLHSNGLIIEAAAAWARRRRRPYVLTMYGTEIWHYKKRRPIDPFAAAYFGAAAVAFYSQRLRDRAKVERLDRKEMLVIYPAVAERFVPQADAARKARKTALGIAEPFVILNVKRLHPLAGQRFLIEAFAQLAAVRRDVRLIICGEGSEREPLARQIAALGLTGRVTMTGLLPNEKIADYVAVADVFALPSLLEALPTVAVEALASGTPVVSADHPGGTELHALFGDDVIVVPRESVDPLARVIGELLSQPRRTRPSTAQKIERLFRPAAVVKAYEDLYSRTLTGSS